MRATGPLPAAWRKNIYEKEGYRVTLTIENRDGGGSVLEYGIMGPHF